MKKSFTWEIAIDLSVLTKAIASAELARTIRVAVEKIIKWREYNGRILASVSGKGGRFVGFWQLETTIQWIVRAISSWTCAKTWPSLRQAIYTGLKRYRYAPESGEALKRAIQQREAYFARALRCHHWADWLIEKMSACQTLPALAETEQLFWRQRRLYESYQTEIERVLAAAKQQRAYLMHEAIAA